MTLQYMNSLFVILNESGKLWYISKINVYSGVDKKTVKAPRHWTWWGEFTGGRWIPHTKGQ